MMPHDAVAARLASSRAERCVSLAERTQAAAGTVVVLSHARFGGNGKATLPTAVDLSGDV
jgi:hypothetical protein